MKRNLLSILLCSVAFLGPWAPSAMAALNVYVEMTANGEAIDGDTLVASIGGVDVSSNHLECHAVNHEIFGGDTGRLSHAPFKLIRRVDKATPLLYSALDGSKRIDATIKYFNNDPDSGVTQHFFTVQLTQGKISSIRQWIPNNLDSAGATLPPLEEISITYQSITFRSETGSTEHVISAN